MVPYEWIKPAGNYSRFGLELQATIRYVDYRHDVAVARSPQTDLAESNARLMQSLPSAFVFLRRAGLDVAMLREYHSWRDYPMHAVLSPLTSTAGPLVHVHTDFWHLAKGYVKGRRVLYADVAIPQAMHLFGVCSTNHVPVTNVMLTFDQDFGGIRPGEILHYVSRRDSPAYCGAT